MDQPTRASLCTPNLLSASRLAAAPLLAFAVLTAQDALAALAIVVAAALTDLFDGVAARAMGRVSTFGAILDALADKIFILTALWLLWGEGAVEGAGAWACLIILWREVLISGLRDDARSKGRAASVSAAAKVKTAAQFSAVIALFASRAPFFQPDLLSRAGIGLLWLSAGLALYTGADYITRAWRGSWT